MSSKRGPINGALQKSKYFVLNGFSIKPFNMQKSLVTKNVAGQLDIHELCSVVKCFPE